MYFVKKLFVNTESTTTMSRLWQQERREKGTGPGDREGQTERRKNIQRIESR